MKVSAPLLSPILRSDTQGRILAELFNNPQDDMTATELSRRARATLPTVLRDLERLVDSGYLTARKVGRSRLVSVNTDHPLFAPLREIVLYAYGPEPVLTQLLHGIPEIDAAYIYGSWAARASGEPGADPNDIDVLLVGDIGPATTYELAREATGILRREVHVNVVSEARWNSTDDGFIETVKSRPLVALNLEGQDVAPLG